VAGEGSRSGRQWTQSHELAAVGPYIEKLILRWCEDSPKTPQPPEIRRQFLAATEAKRPSWLLSGRGDLQMHSTWSGGEASILEMAEAAMERGYEYIAITDHTKGFEELMPRTWLRQ
jgi:hypothetical protein